MIHCESSPYGVRVRVAGLPTIDAMREARDTIASMVSGPFVIECEIEHLDKTPSVSHMRALVDLFDDLDVSGTSIVHPPSRLMTCAKRTFLKLYTPLRPLLITKRAEKARGFVRTLTGTEDDTDEWVEV